jgi:hypothetical protein
VVPDEFRFDGFAGNDAGDEANFAFMPGHAAAAVCDLIDV